MSQRTSVDKDIFLKRAERFYKAWNKGTDGLSDVDAVYVIFGKDEDSNYSKTSSFQLWFYQNELADTLAVLTKQGIYILASNKKADYFNPVASKEFRGSVPPVYPIHRNKADKDKENFATLIKHIEKAGNKLGHFAKDKFAGEFVDLWNAQIDNADFEKVDVTTAFAHIIAVKDDAEQSLCKNACTAATNLWSHLRDRYVKIIEQDKKVKHGKLAAELEQESEKVSVQGNLAKAGTIETAFSPIIMSGGDYSFKWSAESSNSSAIHCGCIISSLGMRFDGYCSNVTRTMLVDPSKDLEVAYENILAVQTEMIQAMRPGVKLCDVYELVVKKLKERDPKLEEHLYKKELGFLTGTQFREGLLTISPKCQEKIEAGMVFVIYLGVEGLVNAKYEKGTNERKAAIAISDTILINADGANEVLTAKAKSRLKSVVVRYTVQEPAQNDVLSSMENTEHGRGKRSVLLNDQTRNKTTNEDKRKEHQKELMQRVNESAKLRLAQQDSSEDVTKVKKSNVSYKNYEKFPDDQDVGKLNIYVDRRYDTVIMPIFGIPVPFHISMIKNCSQSVEGEFTYLRINFAHPGSQIGKDAANFPHPLATYLKELTYRASNVKEHGEANPPSMNLSNALRLIKEIQKRFRTEEAEEREKEGAVKQDKLVLSQGKANPKIKDLYVRPNIIAKRVSGSLEAHVNGFRYTSIRGDRIDVLYNNIKHAFFQPCDGEMIILLHFHLKNPVLWGKKKYKDVQFYTEVGEITTDLGKYHHMQDRDDVQSEQMEREMRRKLNMTFHNFCEKVQKQTNEMVDFDTPFSELGFFGVPLRSNTTLKPTSTCLVSLTEWPPFIVTLDEVELVHFERVSFSLKNFDMVFIFKDYSRKTQMIQQIPMTSLDSVKDWLNSCDIKYNEGLHSLNWQKIMKTITDDPEAFFEDGGWSFLDNDGSDNEEVEDESSDSDAYDPSDDGGTEESESDEDESEGSVVTSDDESGSASLDSDESEGKDWSDLEEEAARADKRKDAEERDGPVDRKRHGGSKSGPPAKRRK